MKKFLSDSFYLPASSQHPKWNLNVVQQKEHQLLYQDNNMHNWKETKRLEMELILLQAALAAIPLSSL